MPLEMLSAGWTWVCPAENGGRVSLLRSTNRELNPWASLSRLQVHFSLNVVAISGSENEAKSTVSGDFAGLSALKEQLQSQAQASSASASGGFAGLSALKEHMFSEKRASPAHLSHERKKAAKKDSASEEREGVPVSIMVSNLPQELTRAEYESFMQQIPEIANCKYLTHKSGRCRGYGFCELRPGADVPTVMEFISSQSLGGRALKASLATVKKESDNDAEQQEVRPKSTREKLKGGAASIQERVRTKFSVSEGRRNPTEKNPKANVKWKNEGRAGPDEQQKLKLGTVTNSDGDNPGRNTKNTSTQSNEGGLLETTEFRPQQEQSGMATTTTSDRDGRLSGQSVLAALERYSSAGRGRQRRAKGTAARSTSSESEDDTKSSDEPQLVQFKLDWAERIQFLEASIEQLKRS